MSTNPYPPAMQASIEQHRAEGERLRRERELLGNIQITATSRQVQTAEEVRKDVEFTATSRRVQTAQEVRDEYANKSPGILPTKKQVTDFAVDASSKLGERLKSRIDSKASGSLKSLASSSGAPIETINGLVDKIGMAGAVGELGKKATETAKKLTSGLVKAKDDASNIELTSKVSDLARKAAKTGESSLNAKLADTIATTGPKDELLAQDVYSFNPGGMLTSYSGKLKDLAKDLGDTFKGGGGLAANLANILKVGSGGDIGVDADALKGRLINAVGGKQGLFNSLTQDFQDTLVDGSDLNPQLMGRVNAVVNGAVRSFQTDDIKSAQGLFNLIGGVLGDNSIMELVDVGAKTQLFSQIYREAINLGIPEAIDIIVAKSNDADRSAIFGLTYGVTDAVARADLHTINTMIDRLGKDALLAASPTAILQILSAYRFTPETQEKDYAEIWNKMNSTLNRLDPDWGYRMRGSARIIDLNVFTYVSEDVKLLLNRFAPQFRDAVMLAPSYTYTPLLQRGREMYPLAYFG